MNKTDALIIGAGPTGLFTAHQLKLIGLDCEIVDNLDKIGGQCIDLYPDNPIYDIPAHPEILAGDLVNNLLEQIKPFSPTYTLGETAEKLLKEKESFTITTNKGTTVKGKILVIAGGLGNFEPRKPNIENILKFEGKGLQYKIINKEIFIDKNIIIAGGGDSALDWTIELSKLAKKVTLIHRRNEFRGAVESVNKIQKLKDKGVVDVLTPATLTKINGLEYVESVDLKYNESPINIKTDFIKNRYVSF